MLRARSPGDGTHPFKSNVFWGGPDTQQPRAIVMARAGGNLEFSGFVRYPSPQITPVQVHSFLWLPLGTGVQMGVRLMPALVKPPAQQEGDGEEGGGSWQIS